MLSKPHLLALAVGLMLPISKQTMAENTSAADYPLEEIRVLAHPLADNGTAQTITVLSGDESVSYTHLTLPTKA